MSLFPTTGLLAMMGPTPQPGQPQPPMWTTLFPMVLLVVVFYVAIIRPQQKKTKQHAEMLKTLRAGDKIVTTGGVVAVVVTVKDKTAMVRSADSKFEITKSAVAEITERSGESAAA